jgi:DNA-directed RNA polymerase specialized sigma24 family protein
MEEITYPRINEIGYTFPEIAKILGISEESARTSYVRGMAKLRKQAAEGKIINADDLVAA